MGYYAIGIGGTGAKCLESLIHLAAAGMMPDDSELYVLFVDPDISNGNLERTQQTLYRYRTCKENLQLGQTHLLKTKIVSADPNLWPPFGNAVNADMNNFFTYYHLHNSLNDSQVAATRLFEMLYPKRKRETTLNRGFRGHPSIGAAVMAETTNLKEEEPWLTFHQKIATDPDPKVFLAGSIFGGTGASGLLTIAQLIKDDSARVNLGGAWVLPYFKFTSNDENYEYELQAKSEAFLMNTQAALRYYHLWNQTAIYDAVYIFGEESQVEVENAVGGLRQQNAPHFIELYAALAATDFFGRHLEPNQDTQHFVTAREQRHHLQWTDLPDGNKGNKVRSKIGQLARFAFAYLSVYRPMLQEIHNNGSSYRAPWFIDFFERNKIGNDQDLLSIVADYCKDFLLWLANLQENSGETETIELVEYNAYAQRTEGNRLRLHPDGNFTLSGFSDLILPHGESDPNALNKLWKHMCHSQRKGQDAQGIGRFLHVLYENCAE